MIGGLDRIEVPSARILGSSKVSMSIENKYAARKPADILCRVMACALERLGDLIILYLKCSFRAGVPCLLEFGTMR